MKVLLIDNYDSFTYNLYHYLRELQVKTTIVRNDKLTIDDVLSFDRIMLSPGPGIPDESGLLKPIIEKYAPQKPILGVCLGLQAIVEVFGGELRNLEEVHHGVDSEIEILVDDEPLYKGLPKNLMVGRYHSWVANKPLPNVLEVTSIDKKDSQIMSVRHKEYPTKGVQFHPESILTPEGKKMIYNWIKYD